ncbi:hypothetical protein BDF14DRAFT_1327250 [Spinellus fusiger]|nr:hypothetical protein BDF14DRAFT_1327250 [Spinellus fusiger]
MVQSQNIAAAAQAEWRLYLRDFINDESGSKWRVLGYIPSYTEDWAWADIRGAAVVDKEDHKIEPSYTGQEPIKQDGIITMADYSLDYNNAGISDSEEREKDVCKVCYIPDHTDGNDIYYCDCCELCVHQLCEVPPIEDFETSIDPWYCRACLNTKGLPVPTPPPGYISRKRKYDTFV